MQILSHDYSVYHPVYRLASKTPAGPLSKISSQVSELLLNLDD